MVTGEFTRGRDRKLSHLNRVDFRLKVLDEVLVKALHGVVDLAGGAHGHAAVAEIRLADRAARRARRPDVHLALPRRQRRHVVVAWAALHLHL